jgi:hypothetical protein
VTGFTLDRWSLAGYERGDYIGGERLAVWIVAERFGVVNDVTSKKDQ